MKRRMRMLLGLLTAGIVGIVCAGEGVSAFKAAVPVWPEGRTEEANAFVGFRADFAVRKGERPVLRVTGSSLYRAWVNGKFAGYGPARAGHGYFRVDEWPLEKLVQEGTNAVAIEVRAYNLFRQGINSIAVQPGFAAAEIVVDGGVRCATGRDFTCVDIPNAKKVSRWSPHRGQIEAYRLRKDWDAWRTAPGFCGMKPARVPSVRLLERIVSYPDFQIRPGRTVSATTFSYDAARAPAHAELEFDAKDVSDRIRDTKTALLPAETRFAPVSCGRGVIADFGGNHAGFCGLTVRCREPGMLWVFVDEMLMNGIVDPVRRTRYATALAYELKEPGEYRLEAFEATALGVVHAFMTSGAAEVGEFYIREYENPDVRAATFRCSDSALERIFAAAQETCAQNTMDAQMDCPSRERMSCPCDGHYTLAGCNLLAGHHAVERLFFDCFCLSTNYCSHVPGRLPGMYPNSAGPGGTASIPNWNMYMALQLERYVRETGDRRLAEALKAKLLETMETLKRSRNAEGLLENVPGWVFVSWDRANGSTKGVNYPTNMLWAEALDAVARLYGVREYAEEAARVRAAVRARSWNGAWFRDSSADDATTESCQAYAFRFGVATPSAQPALWRTFRDELGPCRAKGAHPAVAPSETFIGGTLRLECLVAAGEHRAVLRDVKGYFQRMAETTGTLWEGLDPYAHNMLSHGFNSFVAVCLAKSALGVMSLDRVGKTVELCAPDNGLASCRGSFPTAEGPIVYGWTRVNGKLEEDVRLPPGWSRVQIPAASPGTGKPSEKPVARQSTTPVHKLNVGWWKEHFERNRDWARRHPFDFVFIGDSIMQRWEYEPAGLRVWPEKLAKYRILNCGCAGDRTEHVLWRLDHGEIDGVDPRVVFIHIGTNNAGQQPIEKESPEDTAAGIRAIIARVQAKLPRAQIVLHPIFLRGKTPDDPVRRRNERVNELIRPLADGARVVWMDLRPLFAEKDGTISPEIMKDYLHLTSDVGYRRWADAIIPVMDRALAKGGVPAPRIAEVPDAPEIGRPLPAWREGELDLHFVYTGVGENQFWIFPDGTTVVCDTGDYNAPGYRAAIPLLPSGERTGGEWMARYIQSVTPSRDRIDYMLVSHWHSDHCGELNYAYTTSDGRKTSGLSTVGEFFKVGTFLDHQFPECNRYGVGEAHVAKLTREYVARARAKDGTAQEPFRVGADRQIALRHDPKGVYAKTFGVRNLCANGVVWTGRGEETENLLAPHVAAKGVKGFDENLLSAALLIRYGGFRYYTGGDVCGGLVDAQGKAFSYEARVGAVAGRVDVCKCNHHAWKGTMCSKFVENVEAAAYVINLWSPQQIQDEQMKTMTSRLLAPGARFVFPTFMPEKARTDFEGRPWWREVAAATGHVVVRVAPGGATYRIYVLDAHDERRTVLAAYAGVSRSSH